MYQVLWFDGHRSRGFKTEDMFYKSRPINCCAPLHITAAYLFLGELVGDSDHRRSEHSRALACNRRVEQRAAALVSPRNDILQLI